MRTYIVGDIHGCFVPFDALLDRLSPDTDADRLILLGDLFDRGPDSWEVLQKVKELAAAFGERFVLLRGNHEDYLVQERLPFPLRMVWERVGRQASVRSFKKHKEKLEDCAGWILAQSVLYYKSQDAPPADDVSTGRDAAASDVARHGFFQCVHAGLRVDPPEANDMYTLMHDHEVVLSNCYRGPLTITGHIALEHPVWFAGDGETVRELPEEVWIPLPEQGIICIDAGCGKGGRLIGMVIEGDRFILYGEDS